MVRVLLPLALSGPLCPGLEAILSLLTKAWRIGGTCHQQTVVLVHTQATSHTAHAYPNFYALGRKMFSS